VGGTVTTFVWYLTPALKSRLYELIPAFAVSLVATVVVSLMTRTPAKVDVLMKSMIDD
jgi:Na+/proline symporter